MIAIRSLSRLVLEQRADIDSLKAEVARLRARLPVAKDEPFEWNADCGTGSPARRSAGSTR